MKKFPLVISLFIAVFVFSSLSLPVFAESTAPIEGEVVVVQNEHMVENPQGNYLTQTLQVKLLTGDEQGRVVTIENNIGQNIKGTKYALGDQVYIAKSTVAGTEIFNITDYIRRPALYWLFGIFVLLTIIIAGKKGVYSLLGLAATFLIRFTFVLPQLLAGQNPILIAILGSLGIIFVSFYLTHGFNKKTTIAIIGTVITLITTGVIATLFISASKLSGFASEEASILSVSTQGQISIQGLLLASIIIGMVGILDDITISQTSIAFELKKAAQHLKFRELYKNTMNVGKDHIASIVNTLIVVYTSAALPLLLLFLISKNDFSYLINLEVVAEEVVRTLLASIGLIGAVPITTLLACYVVTRSKSEDTTEAEDDPIAHISHLGHHH